MLPVHYSTMKPPRTSVGFDVCLLTTRVSDGIALHILRLLVPATSEARIFASLLEA